MRRYGSWESHGEHGWPGFRPDGILEWTSKRLGASAPRPAQWRGCFGCWRSGVLDLASFPLFPGPSRLHAKTRGVPVCVQTRIVRLPFWLPHARFPSHGMPDPFFALSSAMCQRVWNMMNGGAKLLEKEKAGRYEDMRRCEFIVG